MADRVNNIIVSRFIVNRGSGISPAMGPTMQERLSDLAQQAVRQRPEAHDYATHSANTCYRCSEADIYSFQYPKRPEDGLEMRRRSPRCTIS